MGDVQDKQAYSTELMLQSFSLITWVWNPKPDVL
jgi:hypothetical protein